MTKPLHLSLYRIRLPGRGSLTDGGREMRKAIAGGHLFPYPQNLFSCMAKRTSQVGLLRISERGGGLAWVF